VQKKSWRVGWWIYGFYLAFLSILGTGLVLSQDSTTPDPLKDKDYRVWMSEDSYVYDGDTIQDVAVRLKTFKDAEFSSEVLWPGILLKDDALYTIVDIRINGIDTPEKRPQKAGRTVESLVREKAAAELAKEALIDLLGDSFILRNPKFGKYAGRIVADVYIGSEEVGTLLSVAEMMIKLGHAKPYDGGEKPKWEW